MRTLRKCMAKKLVLNQTTVFEFKAASQIV